MRAVVVYESMFGSTHLVAEALADGLRSVDGVDADVVVVGGPTHVHGLSRPSTRKAAAETAAKPGSTVELEPDAEGDGLREWFDGVDALPALAAAFDTRLDAPPALTGRASKGIAKRLRHHGCELLDEPRSFLVTKDEHLEEHEEDEARSWGRRLGVTTSERTAAGQRQP